MTFVQKNIDPSRTKITFDVGSNSNGNSSNPPGGVPWSFLLDVEECHMCLRAEATQRRLTYQDGLRKAFKAAFRDCEANLNARGHPAPPWPDEHLDSYADELSHSELRSITKTLTGCWAPSNKVRNKRMHALNGNSSRKSATFKKKKKGTRKKKKSSTTKRAPRSRSVATGRVTRTPRVWGHGTTMYGHKPTVVYGRNTATVTHREYLSDVKGMASSTFIPKLIRFNPGLFPGIGSIATQYTFYRVKRLNVHYEAGVGSVTGLLCMGLDYDPRRGAPPNAQKFSVYDSYSSSSIYTNCDLLADTSQMHKVFPWLLVRDSPSDEPLLQTDACNLWWTSDYTSTSTITGRIYFDVVVELSVLRIQDTLVNPDCLLCVTPDNTVAVNGDSPQNLVFDNVLNPMPGSDTGPFDNNIVLEPGSYTAKGTVNTEYGIGAAGLHNNYFQILRDGAAIASAFNTHTSDATSPTFESVNLESEFVVEEGTTAAIALQYAYDAAGTAVKTILGGTGALLTSLIIKRIRSGPPAISPVGYGLPGMSGTRASGIRWVKTRRHLEAALEHEAKALDSGKEKEVELRTSEFMRNYLAAQSLVRDAEEPEEKLPSVSGVLGTATRFRRKDAPGDCLLKLGHHSLAVVKTRDNVGVLLLTAKDGTTELHAQPHETGVTTLVTEHNARPLLLVYGEPQTSTGHLN
jgi:hypothetical protein